MGNRTTSEQDEELQKLLKASYIAANDIANKVEIKQTNPNGLQKWYVEQIKTIDSVITQLEENQGLKSVCAEGCSHCCKHPIAMLEYEALILKRFLDNYSNRDLKKLEEKVDRVIALIEESGIDTNINNPHISRERVQTLLGDYFKLSIPCVFLEDNKCSIYSVRPTACWSYKAYFTNANCEADHDISNTLKFDDWEYQVNLNVLNKRPQKQHGIFKYLPFVVKDILRGKI